jgi:hypothetical protein
MSCLAPTLSVMLALSLSQVSNRIHRLTLTISHSISSPVIFLFFFFILAFFFSSPSLSLSLCLSVCLSFSLSFFLSLRPASLPSSPLSSSQPCLCVGLLHRGTQDQRNHYRTQSVVQPHRGHWCSRIGRHVATEHDSHQLGFATPSHRFTRQCRPRPGSGGKFHPFGVPGSELSACVAAASWQTRGIYTHRYAIHACRVDHIVCKDDAPLRFRFSCVLCAVTFLSCPGHVQTTFMSSICERRH